MTFYSIVIGGLWLIFIVVWAISAIGAKRNIGGRRIWWREIGLRLAIVVVIVLAFRNPLFKRALLGAGLSAVNTNAVAGIAGMALCALGVGLAIWARLLLGTNWGMPMSQKANPELIKSGPYAYIRHPIYTGVILAVLGTTVGASLLWAIPLVLAAPYLIFSARQEEKFMARQFPEEYPAYIRRTKMLIPFIW
jgi:protein-S-isoprenylcysteine O-methyltransferase Ste14